MDSLNLNGDLLNVAGSLLIGSNVTLDLQELASGFLPVYSSKLTLISYDGSWNNGTFLGYADDSIFTFGANNWKINYDDTTGGANLGGGDFSNFVTMTAVAVPEPTSLVFGLISGAGFLFQIRHRRRRSSNRQV